LSKKLADSIALALVKQGSTSHSPAVLSYGLEILLNSLIKIFTITLIGWMLHILPELYSVIFFFGSFRMITGGVHAHTFIKCLTIGSISFVLLALASPYTLSFFIENKTLILFAFFLFGIVVTWFYVPGRWGNRVYTKKRITVSKWLAVSYLTFILLLSWYITTYLDNNIATEIVWLAVMGITWQCILLTPFGYQLFKKFEELLSWKGAKNVCLKK
jgi:accessory gene regulator B